MKDLTFDVGILYLNLLNLFDKIFSGSTSVLFGD